LRVAFGWVIRCPGADDGFPLVLFLGQFEVEGEEDGEEVVGGGEAVGLKGEGVEGFVEFGELGGGFVEVFVVEFGDAPAFFRPLGAAVFMKF
jgi:hypothetical protein